MALYISQVSQHFLLFSHFLFKFESFVYIEVFVHLIMLMHSFQYIMQMALRWMADDGTKWIKNSV